MKSIFIIFLMSLNLESVLAQTVTKEDIENKIKPLNVAIKNQSLLNEKIKKEIRLVNSTNSFTTAKIDSLINQIAKSNIANTEQLNVLKNEIKATGKQSDVKISKVDKSLSINSLYGIIGVLSAILLSGILYWLLNKRQNSDKSDIIDQLSKTKASIEESLVKEFSNQTELMDAQLILIEGQKATLQASPNVEPDHSLALKVASQINVIENNLNKMDQETKGIKHLRRSMSTLKDNLSANGYDMPVLLDKPFYPGLKVIVTSSISDERLEKGKEIITKILIPAVMYKDKMIQTAQIEVSVG